MLRNKDCFALKLSDVVFIVLINVKMPTILGFLTLMSRRDFMSVELSVKKVFISHSNICIAVSERLSLQEPKQIYPWRNQKGL